MQKKFFKNAKIIQSIFYNNPDTYPPIINSTRLLCDAGFGVDILCRQYGRTWDIAYPSTAQVHRLAIPNRSSWREYMQFVATVLQRARKDAAIFVGHDMHGLLPARILALRYRRPLVYHCHDFAESNRKIPLGSQIIRWFERRWAHTADLVIVPDAQRATVIKAELGLLRAPVIVANAPLKSVSQTEPLLSQALAAQKHTFSRIVLRQGRIGPGHAIEATIRSLPYWACRDWGFVVIGAGEEDYIQYLKTLATELDVTKQFVVLPPVAYDAILKYTVGADLGHTLYEPIHINNQYITTASNKLMEYLAAGLPLLASKQPDLSRFVEQYECGVAVNESSPEHIADGVNSLLSNALLAHRMGKASRKIFDEIYSYSKQFSPVLQIFDEWCNHSKREVH